LKPLAIFWTGFSVSTARFIIHFEGPNKLRKRGYLHNSNHI
jgi:hypothetical protein